MLFTVEWQSGASTLCSSTSPAKLKKTTKIHSNGSWSPGREFEKETSRTGSRDAVNSNAASRNHPIYHSGVYWCSYLMSNTGYGCLKPRCWEYLVQREMKKATVIIKITEQEIQQFVPTCSCRSREMETSSTLNRSSQFALFIYFLAQLFIPHHCTCRGLVLHVTTYTNIFTVGKTPLGEWSARPRGLYLLEDTTLTTDKYPCLQRDSNPLSQQAKGQSDN
jgi:hypothetical protein